MTPAWPDTLQRLLPLVAQQFISMQQTHVAAEEKRRAIREGTYMEAVDSREQQAASGAGSESGAAVAAAVAAAAGSRQHSSSGAADGNLQ